MANGSRSLPAESAAAVRAINTVYGTGIQPFWDDYRKIFTSFGITLCDYRSDADSWQTCNLVPSQRPAILPFSNGCTHTSPGAEATFPNSLSCGQDDMQRIVVIKLVDHGTDEHDIYSRLSRCEVLYNSDPRNFVGVLPPTAILSSPHGFSFVVMPMWTTSYRICMEDFDTIREIFTFIRCTLKGMQIATSCHPIALQPKLQGLSFLHDMRIAHRDIDDTNIAANWYCYDMKHRDHRRSRILEHCRSPDAVNALFDFDLSLQLPPETSLKKCRRPAEEAWIGKLYYHPRDVTQGEWEYNPFALDVACLGNIFLFSFAEAVAVVPLLAPLFGRMTFPSIDSRFTAEEALTFFREIEAGLTPDVLDSKVVLNDSEAVLDDPDLYWARLSPEFQRHWRSHRPMPPSQTMRLLRWAMHRVPGAYKVITYVRKVLRV